MSALHPERGASPSSGLRPPSPINQGRMRSSDKSLVPNSERRCELTGSEHQPCRCEILDGRPDRLEQRDLFTVRPPDMTAFDEVGEIRANVGPGEPALALRLDQVPGFRP